MKRILSFILCITMILSLTSVAFAEHYSNFTDVKPDSWYYEDVDNAVRLGIINGKTETTFAPDDNLTYAEAIKLAACMYQLYKDGSVYLVPGGNPWYQIYVDYAKDHGIITENFFYKVSNINEKATRAGYMEIFANALPDEALKGINNVPDGSIPDVPMVHESSISIYKLYRAGILTGVDAKHNCKPEDNIKRCEVAAIITRMMDETKRVKFSMGTTSEEPKTEEPKTEEPETEKPKLEIPKDAEPAPEIKEEESSAQKVETTDMYEPFEIAVQPLLIDGADEGEKLEYTVTATGGKTPYTYEWSARSWHNQWSPLENGEYIKGAKTKTLFVTFSMDNPLTSQFRCKVTDALGQEVISDYVTLPEQAFIFKPEDVIKYNSGYIFTGRVEKGALRAGETVSMHMPSHGIEVFGIATKLEMFKKSIDEVKENDYCGILIEEPEEIPYDSWVVENLGETLAERLINMGNYGFKAWMHITPCRYSADVGDKTYVQVNVFGGKAPYTYEWYKSENSGDYTELKSDNNHKVDEGKVEILVDEAEFSKRMTYKCIITDATGFTKTASNMYVVPKTTPYLAYQPNTVRANYGEEVSFYARTRNSDATYQWYIKNDNTNGWKKIEPTDTWAKGATTSTLKIQVEKADFISHCEYKCEVTQGSYSVSSNVAKLLPKDIVITEQPKNVSAKHAEKAKFKVMAEGENGPFTYQWLIQTPDNEIPLMITEAFPWAEGYYTDTLSVAVDENKLTSDYKFSCIVTDKNGVRRISNEAYVIVTADANVNMVENYPSKPGMIVIMD